MVNTKIAVLKAFVDDEKEVPALESIIFWENAFRCMNTVRRKNSLEMISGDCYVTTVAAFQ